MKFPYKFRETPSLKNGKKKAFALVLALALMGFMVLLVVSLATMVQMQMRLSRQSLNDFKAKQAAKYAAYDAMSQIQSTLGPDQRISANAKIFDDAVADDIKALEDDKTYEWWRSPMALTREDVEQINDVALSQNRYWVGVWNSAIGYAPDKIKQKQERADYIQSTVKKALTWLVSGNGIRGESDKEGASVKFKPNAMLEAGKYVRAVAAGSHTDSQGVAQQTTDVLAPIVTLEKDPDPISGEVRSDGKETRIAWWVSDEGQKASLNAIAPRAYTEHAQTIKYRKQSLPFYSGIHGLTLPNSNSPAFDLQFDDTDDTSSLSKVRNLDDIKQLDVIKGASVGDSQSLSKIFFHDVTFNTHGLLVNVREGGLKKDLSLGLTKKDFSNENPTDKGKTTMPIYFERPYGIGGYDYKTSAFPLIASNNWRDDRRTRNDRRLKGLGHIFGPQMYGHEDMKNGIGFESASSVTIISEVFDDRFIWKDTGGPLWDQLRSYYNMRADDKGSSMIECVQTDDRIALKPVVKRFQIFFVPCFTRYDQSLYGLRLNIVPMLVLWNPYDVKIGGTVPTYYAIRVYSEDRHAVGAFRFAIGYESGGRFQCLRDLITEEMPFYGRDPIDTGQNIHDNANYLRRYAFRLSRNGIWNASASDSGLDYYFNKASITNSNSAALPSMMSKKTLFWASSTDAEGSSTPQIDANFSMFYPLGYGSIAPAEFAKPPSTDPKDPMALTSIVTESNLAPNFKDAFVYSFRNANEQVRTNPARSWSGRVAKIPLYLNNLLISVAHGQVNAKDTNHFFYGQRDIDSYDPNNYSSRGGGGARLHFLAKDDEGIEPGEAKLFVMENIINYMGDPSAKGNSFAGVRGGDGPNGAVEYRGKDTSPYENKEALMTPYKNNVGCFYLDVPHAETENQFKYDGSFRPWWGNLYGKGTDKKNRYAIFDLDRIRLYNNSQQLKDIQRNNPPTDISQYMIDMEDIVGVNNPHVEKDAHAAFYATMNLTPIGYGLVTYYSMYLTSAGWTDQATTDSVQGYFAQHRVSETYWNMRLDVWMWKREGYKFSETNSNLSVSNNEHRPDFGPMLATMQGYRFFMGDWQHSFPDPTITMVRDANYYNESRNAVYNGLGNGTALQTGGNGTFNLAALTYYNDYSTMNRGYFYADDSRLFNSAAGKSPELEYKNFGDDVFDKDDKIKDDYVVADGTAGNGLNFRLRYYLNWLGVNSRRHSANSWIMYGQKQNYQWGDLLDAPPAAVRSPLIIDAGNNNYQAELNKNLAESSINDNKVPYGIVFLQSYPNSELGLQGFFNTKMLANRNVMATTFGFDFNGRNMNTSTAAKEFGNSFGRLQKTNQALTQIYGTNDDGISQLAYKINNSGGRVRIGVSSEKGSAYKAPLFHVLRETEVVSNPANLIGAQLSFSTGNYQAVTWSNSTDTAANKRLFDKSYGVGYPEDLTASLPIGNSLCPSRIVPDRSYQVMWIDGSSKVYFTPGSNYNSGKRDGVREENWYEDKNTLYDMSWHLNNILWDEYFFSTLPYRNDEFANPVDPETAMPQNPRIQYCKISPNALGETSQLLLEQSAFRSEVEDQYVENAARFWINGAFNVNSTSVDAWKAVLSTYFGDTLEGYDGSAASLNEKASMSRYAAPYSASDPVTQDVSIDDDSTYMNSFRALSTDEIEELALSIVEHVKDRGPFYSMSHFVNRVVSNPSAEERFTDALENNLLPKFREGDDRKNLEKEYEDDGGNYKIRHMQKGVLQDSIDRTKINRAFHTDDDYIISVDNERNITKLFSGDPKMNELKDPRKIWENWRGAIGPQTTGVPGYLMQQDILSRIGSFLTVRSDTFKIRAYGEVRNPISGIVEGKAWCEMVVQRVPEYIDQTEADQEAWRVSGREIEIGSQNGSNVNIGKNKLPLDEIIDELGADEVNKALGRRFKVIAFKWLNEKEI